LLTVLVPPDLPLPPEPLVLPVLPPPQPAAMPIDEIAIRTKVRLNFNTY
jgi:hypothetical protein